MHDNQFKRLFLGTSDPTAINCPQFAPNPQFESLWAVTLTIVTAIIGELDSFVFTFKTLHLRFVAVSAPSLPPQHLQHSLLLLFWRLPPKVQ